LPVSREALGNRARRRTPDQLDDEKDYDCSANGSPAADPDERLDIQAALDTIDAIKADASLARFQFRARNTWINAARTAR